MALALVLSACTLDERTLHAISGVGGAAGDAGHGGNGGVSASGGNGGATSDLVDGCADLDTDGIADCTVTLVGNASFTTDVVDWTADGEALVDWDPQNALSDAPSGSLKMSASATRASASQCVPLAGEKLVIAYANVLVPGTSVSAQAQVEVSFFDQADCKGARLRYFQTPPSTSTDSWVTVQAGGLSRPSTSSLSVALVGVQSVAASAFDVYFDNVMIKAREP